MHAVASIGTGWPCRSMPFDVALSGERWYYRWRQMAGWGLENVLFGCAKEEHVLS